MWDLNSLAEGVSTMNGSAKISVEQKEQEELVDEFGNMSVHSSKSKSHEVPEKHEQSSTGCILSISAHSRPITSLYFDSGNLVTFMMRTVFIYG